MPKTIPTRITVHVSQTLANFLSGGAEGESTSGRLTALEDRYRVMCDALCPQLEARQWELLVEHLGGESFGGRRPRLSAERLPDRLVALAPADDEGAAALAAILADFTMAERTAVIDRIERLRSGQDLEALTAPPEHRAAQYPAELRARARRLWESDGLVGSEIAKRTDVPWPTIYRWAREEQWSPRGGGSEPAQR